MTVLEKTLQRRKEIFDYHFDAFCAKTDRIFAGLFLFQWVLAVALAVWLSPKTWSGNSSEIHIHVYAAIFLGGVAAMFPIYLAMSRPGQTLNRYVIATSQMLFSTLLIHITGGRIETHFHIFVSLAFLAFYRNYRVLALATFITVCDHLVRGMWWPESVYGVVSASPLRALEHAAWVLFEDVILILSINVGLKALETIAKHQADVEMTLAHLESLVEERTNALTLSRQQILAQQQVLISTSKMSALGEMAGGVAHEINTPLSIISMRAEQMEECLRDGDLESMDFMNAIQVIKHTTDRIAKIVSGLRLFAREGKRGAHDKERVCKLVNDTLSFCKERFANHGVQLDVITDTRSESAMIECRSVEISQVVLNLLNNAYDAISTQSEKRIQLEIKTLVGFVEVSITDNGPGIPKDIQDKIMQPFFTTKDVGKGTGLGLSISKGIVDDHHGELYLDTNCSNTRFVLRLPLYPPDIRAKEIA